MSVQVTNKDIVLLGHGSYPGGATNTLLPENIDLYILQPIGYTLMTDVASAMIHQVLINTLILHNVDSGTSMIEPAFAIYKGGNLAPDLTLHNLGILSEWGEQTIGNKANVVTVSRSTLLSELIKYDEKIQEAIEQLSKREKLKLYWSACVNQVSGHYASLT